MANNNNIQNLNPEQIAEIWAERAQILAEPPAAETKGATLNLLSFLLAGERYGLEVRYVREIHPLEHITPVPRTPGFVVGIFSARGRLVSVVDLRAFFGLPVPALSDDSNIIVVEDNDFSVGFLVDRVIDVITIFKDEIEPPLATEDSAKSKFSLGIGPQMTSILNLQALLNDKRLIIYEELV